MKKTKIEQVKEKLIDKLMVSGHLQSGEKIKHISPGHGICCTCQKCGYNYDDCVCFHNELLDTINEAFNLDNLKRRLK